MATGTNEQQEFLRTNAREFLERECPPTLVRQLMEDERGYSPDLWRSIAELGWLGLALPEAYGGADGSFSDLAVLFDEIGYFLVPSPFLATAVLGGYTVLAAGNDSQKQEILPRLAAGELILTLAIAEEDGRYEPDSVQVQAEASGNGYTLTGTKLFVLDANIADRLIVVGRTAAGDGAGGGLTLFLVDPRAGGVSITRLKTMDMRNQCEVRFEGVAVDGSQVLGPVGGAWPTVKDVLLKATAALTLEMAGGARKALDMTVEYAKNRVQFGQPIGSFQAIKHRCANMAMDVESARGLAYAAAEAITEDRDDKELVVATAKAFLSEAYRRVTESAIQVHGGIGFTWEHDIHLYLRRAATTAVLFGDADFHRETVAQSLG